jgi:hypothetical protein
MMDMDGRGSFKVTQATNVNGFPILLRKPLKVIWQAVQIVGFDMHRPGV